MPRECSEYDLKLLTLCFQVLIILLLDYHVAAADGVQVTLTSSPNTPNIAEGDTAVYNCSSNHSSVVILWFFNTTTPSTDPSLEDLGVTASRVGATVSSLSVPGLVYPFNNTEILCFASGPGFDVTSPPPVILRVQGPPGAVVNKSVNFSSCTYYISWTAPFTLSGFPILQYNINITNGSSTVIQETNTTATEWSFIPEEFGNYSVTIAAVNRVGEGEIDIIPCNASEYIIDDVILADQYRYMEYWIIDLNITVSSGKDWLNCVNRVTMNDYTNISMSSNIMDVDNDQLIIATFNTSSITDDQNYDVTIHIVHTSGLQVNYGTLVTLSFFDVVNVSIAHVKDSNTFKFRCEFVRGSQAIGCHISLNNSTLIPPAFDIARENETALITLPPGYWSIAVFDINHDNTTASSPAVTSTVHVSMASSISSTTHSYTLSSSSELMSTLPAASSTVIATIPPPVAASISSGTIGGITSSIIAAMMIVVIAIIVGFVFYRRKKITKANMQNTGPVILMGSIEATRYELNTCLYAEVGPWVKPSMSNPLYADILDAPDSGMSDTAVNGITSTYSMIESANIEEPVQIDSTYSEVGPVAAVNAASDEQYTENKKLTQEILSEHAAPHLTSKWRLMGLALAITPPQLDDIEERIQEEDEEGKGQEEINEVFRVWEEQKTRAFDWDTLLTTLRSEAVGESELSDELAKLQV